MAKSKEIMSCLQALVLIIILFMNHIAIVILNTKINEKVFHFYRDKVKTIICADGGANRLYDLDKTIIP
jgi:hypothetical protein